MVARTSYIPHRGDVVYVHLNPTRGHEQSRMRPALILSPKEYNGKTGMALVAPITSQVKGYPFEVAHRGKKITGVVLADQVRTLDWRARDVSFTERTDVSVVSAVQEKLCLLVKGV